MFSEKLIGLGLDRFFQQQLLTGIQDDEALVRVMNVHRSGLHVTGDQLDQQVRHTGADHDIHVTVGDWVLLNCHSQKISRRLERKSIFKRRAPGSDRREQLIAANIDTLFIVSSCNSDFNEARMERYLAIAKEAQVMTLIVLTKADMTDAPREYLDKAVKLAPGVQVEAVNALQAEALRCLDPWLGEGQTIALLGSSGVGKSTITNTLLGRQAMATRAIREDDARGRHTTTSRSMHHLPGGAWLLDTPGMRELQLTDVKTGLDDVFAEISSLSETCRFSDCQHQDEPGCSVKQALDSGQIDQARLKRWRKLVREDALNSASIAERRASDRALGRFYKSVINAKARAQKE